MHKHFLFLNITLTHQVLNAADTFQARNFQWLKGYKKYLQPVIVKVYVTSCEPIILHIFWEERSTNPFIWVNGNKPAERFILPRCGGELFHSFHCLLNRFILRRATWEKLHQWLNLIHLEFQTLRYAKQHLDKPGSLGFLQVKLMAFTCWERGRLGERAPVQKTCSLSHGGRLFWMSKSLYYDIQSSALFELGEGGGRRGFLAGHLSWVTRSMTENKNRYPTLAVSQLPAAPHRQFGEDRCSCSQILHCLSVSYWLTHTVPLC